MTAPLLVLALLLAPLPAAAELVLPAGFSATVYVTGDGFDSDAAGFRPPPRSPSIRPAPSTSLGPGGATSAARSTTAGPCIESLRGARA